MANKPTQPVFPLGLAAEEQSTLAGVLNTGTIEHGPDAVLTLPEGNASAGLPSSVRYNADSDEFEGFYENGGWLPLGGGGIRWEVLPHASTTTLTEGRGYLINNTTGASTVVLPSPTRIGDSVTICDAYGKFATYPLTVSPSGNNLYGSNEDMAITTDNVSATFTWSGPEQGWVITSGVGLGQGRVYSREIFTQILASETSAVTLNTPPTIVDVYADGKRLAESKYSLDGNVITFSPSLPDNTELQVIEYTPIQLGNGGGSGSSTITWVYNGGSAIGGETEITLDVVVDDVPAIDINGSRQYKNLGFTFDPLTSKITLAQELEPEDEVVVIINGTPNIYNQIDRSLQEVARATNVKDSEVILSIDTTQTLNGKKIVYSVSEQKAYGLPMLPTNVYVQTVANGKLTYNPGSVVVDLLPLPNDNSLILDELSKPTGSFIIGTCPTVSALRSIEPTRINQIIHVDEHSTGLGFGGGSFKYVSSDTTSVDDDGVVIVTTNGKRWIRECSHITSEHYGLVPGSSTDVSNIVNRALLTALSIGVERFVFAKGSFYVLSAIKVPSGITVAGSGNYASAVIALPTAPITVNVIQNLKYNYKVFGTDYDENIRIENLIVDANNRARNATETWMDATQGTTVMFTTVRNCVLDRVWVRRSLQHGIDIAAGYYFNDGNINNEPVGGSYDVVVKDCIGQNTQLDDVFTCHNSRRLKFIRCKAWNDDPSMVWGNNQHGFEIDEGCSDVIVRDCYAQNFITGFQQKGHDSTMPARNVVFDNCIAEDCVMSFQVEHRNASTIPPGQVHNARSSRIVNCTSINANNSKQPSIHARVILIDGFYGVFVDNLRIKGGAGNIYLSRGASNVYINGVYCDGGYTGATDSTSEGIIHVETNANCDNYHISNITVSDEISVPVVRDLTDSIQVRRSITNITARGSNATIPMIAVTLGSGDTINGLQTLGSWKCAVRDMPRAIGNGDYSSTVSFLNGVSTETGSGTPNNGIVCGKAGSLYIDVGTGGVAGERYYCTDVGINHWVKVTTA